MSAIDSASWILRRSAVAAALLCCSRVVWSQTIDLEAVDLTLLPSGPSRFDLQPVIAGRLSPGTNQQVFYRVYRGGQVIASNTFTLRYPSSGACAPSPCGGTCAVELQLQSWLPFVSVAGECIDAASGGCWCSFSPVELHTSRRIKCTYGHENLVLVLDPLNQIQELDESNNTWTSPFLLPCGCDEGAGGSVTRRSNEPARPRSIAPTKLAREPLPTRPVQRMVYDYARQKVERHGVPQKRFSATYCYVNTDTVGFAIPTTFGTEFLDWGILGGTATTKCCGLSDIVSGFTFAYGTSTLDTSIGGPGAALTLTFYTNFTGFCADSGLSPVASFSFTGMPGYSGASSGVAATYAFSVDLSGGFEFCMPDGRFGYGYRGDGHTGPMLCWAAGGSGGPEPCTGNWDVFDIWAPDTQGVCLGTYFVHGFWEWSSWYGQIARADLSTPATLATRNAPPNKAGSLACSPAVLGGTLVFTVLTPGKAAAVLFAFDTQLTLPLSGGQVLLCIDGGSGELLTGGGLAALPTGASVGGCPELAASVSVSKNLTLCGLAFTVQAVLLGPPPFALSNACDLTVGG